MSNILWLNNNLFTILLLNIKPLSVFQTITNEIDVNTLTQECESTTLKCLSRTDLQKSSGRLRACQLF